MFHNNNQASQTRVPFLFLSLWRGESNLCLRPYLCYNCLRFIVEVMEALWRREEDGTLALVIGGTTLLTAEDILSLSLLFVIACKADVLENQ